MLIMLYCFITELVNCVEKDDPYWIQRQYALHLNKYIEFSFESESFLDAFGNAVSPPKDCILWIGDCLYADAMDEVSEKYELDSIDTAETRKKIREWYNHGITQRTIFSTDKKGVLNYAERVPCFFVKTEKKGHSLVVQRNLRENSHLFEDGGPYIISDYVDIVEDRIGKKEARFIVFRGNILNGSRYVHSIYHVVEERFFKEAERIKGLIDSIEGFPTSYVVDIAHFIDNGTEYYDIVEINSLSTALCYVNNSFYEEMVPEIEEIHNRTCWGYEYCYDYMINERVDFFNVDNPKEYLYQRY
ncbi:MAG: hypothetical protein PUB52_02040 [Lachnospiraceae bacterium]|nr:hypothetical protein [Lachnospiraceae bacterium]